MSRAAKRTDSDLGRGRMSPSKAGPPTLSPPCVWRRRKRGARSRVLPQQALDTTVAFRGSRGL